MNRIQFSEHIGKNYNGGSETERSQLTQRIFNKTSRSPNASIDTSKEDAILAQDKIGMQSVYAEPKKYKRSERIDVLAMPKPQYHGKDFFQRQEFRGLFLADHQEAIGERAFKCVDTLNQETVSKFN